MLERLLHGQDLWSSLHRIYWWVAGVVLLAGIPLQVFYAGPALIHSAWFFGLMLLPCYWLGLRWPGLGPSLHILLGGLTIPFLLSQSPENVLHAVLAAHWQGVLIGTGIWIAFSMGIFGGIGGAVLYVLAMVLALPGFDPASRSLFAAVCFGSGMSGVGMRQLIGRLEAAYKQVDKLAHQDSLTGLGNRRSLEQDFNHYQALAKREGKPLLLSLWDLDALKQINDQQGHHAGDAHLLRFVQVLLQCSRESDRFYRTGGDEFCGIHLGLDEGSALVSRVLQAFPKVSVGFSEARLENLSHALREADRGMYAQKQMKARAVSN